jgi:hypothetical protein
MLVREAGNRRGSLFLMMLERANHGGGGGFGDFGEFKRQLEKLRLKAAELGNCIITRFPHASRLFRQPWHNLWRQTRQTIQNSFRIHSPSWAQTVPALCCHPSYTRASM